MQHPRRTIVTLGIMVVCLLLGASMGNVTASGDWNRLAGQKVTPTARPAASPKLPTLRLAMPDALINIDPAEVATEENAELASLLYIGLVRLDAHYHVVPAAAQRYTISPDHRVYTFYLRHNLRFSNGARITAYDFRFSILRSLDPALKSSSAPTYLIDIAGASARLAGKAASVVGIKVLNDYTLQLTARWPVPYFLMELTYPTSYVLDEKAIKRLGPVDNSSWYTNPVTSGPYRLKSWVPNQKIVLVPNKYYAGPAPKLRQIVISLASLPSVPLADLYQYVSKSFDIVSLPTGDPALAQQPGVHETKMLAIDGVYMNLKWKPFGNQDVRRALIMALDRDKLVEKSMGDAVTPFGGYVPLGETGNDPGLHLLPYNPRAARAALKVGLDGKPFPPTTLYYLDDPTQAQLATTVARAWHRNLGVTVSTQALTSSTLLAKAQSESLPLYVSGWSADYPDPHDWLSSQWKSQVLYNNVDYASKPFDALVEAADVTWNHQRRQSLYDQAQQILVNDAAWLPLYIPHRLVYIRPQVQNVSLTGYGLIPTGGAWGSVHIQAAPISIGHRAS